MADSQFNLVLLASFVIVALAASWATWKLLDFVCHLKDCENE